MNDASCELFIITGYSGAGKTTALRAFEDAGFFCVDNLPSALIGPFFQLLAQGAKNRFALGLDIRSGDTLEYFVKAVKEAKNAPHIKVTIIFFIANSSLLQKRFQETRRSHPLAHDRDMQAAIELEKKMLEPLKVLADVIVPTDQLSAQQLRHFVCSSLIEKKNALLVNLVSFGFKYGAPSDCNYVYDLRSLPNPYIDPQLRVLDGTSDAIQNYLFNLPDVQEYWQRFFDFFSFTLERSYKEGRFFITVALGCTGGRHRSVAFVHKLSLLQQERFVFVTKHRDIQADSYVKEVQVSL
ncbi:MAG: RNase adapter RapZ [Candidatus Babeliales bacterium]